MSRPNSFTLIELLVVIGIVAILSVAVLLALNPTQLMAQGRDATRLNDLDMLHHALTLYAAEQSNFGSSTVVYVSVPDPSLSGNSTNTCTNLGLPVLPAGYNYQCVSGQNLQKTDGTGWLPVNFTQITSKPLSQLPIDPINTTSSGNYYTYTTNGSQWELTALAESQKYKSQPNSKTPSQPGLLTQGTNLALSPIFNSSGLVGYWPLDEGTGTVTYDQSGNGNNGAWSGSTPYYATAKVGAYAGIFNGSNDVVTINNSSSTSNGNGDFTLSFWFNNPGINSADDILSKGSNGPFNPGGSGWEFRARGATRNQLEFCINGGGTCPRITITFNNWNVWTHIGIIVSRTNNIATMYLNGSTAGSMAYAPTYTDTFNTLIGRGNDSYFPGSIDDIRLYNRALSASEIAAIYNATK